MTTRTVEAQPGDTIVVTVNGVPTVALVPRPTETYTEWDAENRDAVPYEVPKWMAAGIELVRPGEAAWKGGKYLGNAGGTGNVKIREATIEAVATAVQEG
jgi:antitoxin (DNA-binding transcriptional repressor) of toxin-antitoxin stability system